MIIRQLLQRFFYIFLTLLLASVVVFLITNVVPGDPASFMMGLNASPEAIAVVREDLGIDQPLLVRYVDWVLSMARGDFGESYTYRVPVGALLSERLTVSLPLALYAFVLSSAIGMTLGIAAAYFHRKNVDTLILTTSQLGLAIPNFWLALMLVFIFAMGLQWVPAGGFPGWNAGFLTALSALTLPALALGLPQAAILARITRTSLLDVLSSDYIRTARAKGLSRFSVLLRHGLRNGMIPILTILGMQFSFLLAGAVIVEKVFFLPGLGQLLVQAIAQRDLIVVQSTIMVFIAAVLIISFLVEALYLWIDPRLRSRGGDR